MTNFFEEKVPKIPESKIEEMRESRDDKEEKLMQLREQELQKILTMNPKQRGELVSLCEKQVELQRRGSLAGIEERIWRACVHYLSGWQSAIVKFGRVVSRDPYYSQDDVKEKIKLINESLKADKLNWILIDQDGNPFEVYYQEEKKAEADMKKMVSDEIEQFRQENKIANWTYGELSNYYNNFHTHIFHEIFLEKVIIDLGLDPNDYLDIKSATEPRFSEKRKAMTKREFLTDIDATIQEVGLNKKELKRLFDKCQKKNNFNEWLKIIFPLDVRLREKGYNFCDLIT